ncbi:hypothetical protein [Occallatibacter savannae]|uniref:hypothetical protein n=1 Tax=Occallatibacter savannae TaxID=1002691 RepID=UPI0013A5AE09|nr:hypothetical protein [Occallatibacter savannae]
MNSSKSHHLLKVLRATLLHVETSADWSQDDPAVIELRAILERRIHQELAELPDDLAN